MVWDGLLWGQRRAASVMGCRWSSVPLGFPVRRRKSSATRSLGAQGGLFYLCRQCLSCATRQQYLPRRGRRGNPRWISRSSSLSVQCTRGNDRAQTWAGPERRTSTPIIPPAIASLARVGIPNGPVLLLWAVSMTTSSTFVL
jgi:hypothetical protein